MKIGSLIHYLKQAEKEGKDDEVYVYVPHYKRKFQIVALQRMGEIDGKETEKPNSLGLIAAQEPD